MKKTGKKRNCLLASILATSMILTMSPFAFAADGETTTTTLEQVQSTENEISGRSEVSETGNQLTNDTIDSEENIAVEDSDSNEADGAIEGETPTEGGTDTTGEDENLIGDSTDTPVEETDEPQSESAARIDETEYVSITAAIAAVSDKDTIVLLRDVEENITINKSLTLDLNNHTLTGIDDAAVVTISGEETKVTVKNGTVTGGRNPQNGGGFAIDSADIKLENLTIEANEAAGTGNGEVGGGGIYAESATVSMTDVNISGNKATGNNSDGGGILVKYGSLTMTGCTVEGNSASDCGGGMLVEHATLAIKESDVSYNTAKNGAGVYFYDAADRAESDCTSMHSYAIDGSTISYNTATSIGGGMYVGTTSDVTISNSTLSANDGTTQGGAIVAYSAKEITLDKVTISDNKAQSGAGIFALGTDVCDTTISLEGNTAVKQNSATNWGGGIYATALSGNLNVITKDSFVNSNTATYGGAGVFTYKSGSAVINVYIGSGTEMHDNQTSGSGGAIYTYNAANINVAEGSALYNNTASNAGDDLLLNGGTSFTLPNAKTMSGDRILSSDKAEIIGWYHDGWYKWVTTATNGAGSYTEIGRWSADTADEYVPVEKDSHAISLKAAHPLMYTLTYSVTGVMPEGYTAPETKTLVANNEYTVADVPANVTGTRDGINGTFSFAGWKTETDMIVTGKQTLTADTTLYGVWTFTAKKSSGGSHSSGGNSSRDDTITIPDDVPTGLNGDDHYAYIVGYPDSTVRPQNGITRAEVATIFFRLLTDETRDANSTFSNNYSDVAEGAWYNHAVSTLSAMGIIKGSNGKFNPNAPITRAEFAAIAARFDENANTTAADFSDIGSHWAKDEISAAANNGWINGYTDGTFRPNNKITRAEAMTLVNRVLKRLPETAEDLHNDMIKWSDNSDTSAWYYLAVQEATNSHYYDTKENQYEKWNELRETRDWTELEK